MLKCVYRRYKVLKSAKSPSKVQGPFLKCSSAPGPSLEGLCQIILGGRTKYSVFWGSSWGSRYEPVQKPVTFCTLVHGRGGPGLN